jgi:hypothetical protein
MDEQQKWELRAASAARTGLDVDAIDVVVLPAYSGKTVRGREERKESLRDYLQEQLAELSKKRRFRKSAPAEAEDVALDARSLERLCAACRGHCCRTGGEHAYLSPRTFKRVLEARPGLGGDALIELYLDHVPARSYARSCIFHTASGCALPRELRSETCNRFFCSGIDAMKQRASAHPERAILAVFELSGWLPWVRTRLMMIYRGKAGALRPERK